MSSICRLFLLAWLAILTGACGTYRYPGTVVSLFNVAMSPVLKETKGYPSTPSYDPNDFQPAGGSMELKTERDQSSRLDLSLEVYQPLPADFLVGFTVGYLSLGNDTLQSANVHWWDWIQADRLALERTPSVGGYVGWLFSSTKEAGLFSLQYGLSVSGYQIKHYAYEGIDVYGGKNYSIVKSVTVLDHGVSIWQTVEVTLGFVRFGVWWESDGSKEQLVGLRIGMMVPVWSGKPRLACEVDRYNSEYWKWSRAERVERDQRCGDLGSLLDP